MQPLINNINTQVNGDGDYPIIELTYGKPTAETAIDIRTGETIPSGDEVFYHKGTPLRISFLNDQFGKNNYKVLTSSDGRKFVVHKGHQGLTDSDIQLFDWSNSDNSFDRTLAQAYKSTGLKPNTDNEEEEPGFWQDLSTGFDNAMKREFGWAGYGGQDSPRFRSYQAAANKDPNFMKDWKVFENAMDGLNWVSDGLWNKLAPSQLVRFVRDVANGENVLEAWFNPNSGFVTEEYARNNPKKAFAINFAGDVAVGGSLFKGKSMYNAGKNNINKYLFQASLNNASKNFKIDDAAFLNNRNPTANIFGDNYYHTSGGDFTKGIGTVSNSTALADAANKSQSFWSYKMPWGERVYGKTTYEVPKNVFGDRVATTDFGKPRPGVSVIDQGNAKFIDKYYPQTGEVYLPKGSNKYSVNFYNQEGGLQYQPHVRFDKKIINGVPTEVEVITGNTNRPTINGYYDLNPDFNTVKLGNQTTIPSQEANMLLQNSTYKFYPTFNIGTKGNPITIFGKGIHITK